MKYFVIGAGSIGQRHYQNLIALGADASLFGWRDIDLSSVLSQIHGYGERAAVVVATSTEVRLPLILDCARKGAALYIEKPVAFKTSELEEIYKLPEFCLSRSVAGFMMRYHPMVQKLLEYRNETFFRAHFEIGHDVRQWRKNWTFGGSYASSPNGGGVLLDLCHEVDIAQLICGSAPIACVRSISDIEFPGVDIASQVTFCAEDGRNYDVSMDYLSPHLIRRGSLTGTTLQLEYNLPQGLLRVTTGDEHRSLEFEVERNHMFLAFMRDFMKLAEGEPTLNPFIPRLDSVQDVCHTIATAWKKRQFTGSLKSGLRAD